MKHTVTTLSALVATLQEELVQLRAEVAQLRVAHAPDAELTPSSECPEYPPMDTPYDELTPVSAPAVPVLDDHARELKEFAALNCGIGYIRTQPKVRITYYTSQGIEYKKFSTSRAAVSVNVTGMSKAERDAVVRTL